MPPKKKARTSGSNLAANTKTSAAAPATVAEICEARIQLKDWIADAYSGRHGFATERAYPLKKGGSFLDIVSRCWFDETGKAGKHVPDIIADSLRFCQKLGIVDSSLQCEDFLEKYFNYKDFPPAPGTYFATNILQWSFEPEAFWRAPDMATVFDVSKSIALVGWKDGETLGMRLPAGFENAMQDDDQQLISTLHFDEGGMRGLAAAIVWCGLVYFVDTLGDDKVCDPQVVALSRSLLGIPTYFKHQESDPARAMIGRIIRQNVEAKKLAVSSFEWSQILASMVADGEKVTVAMAVEMYNNNPEVAAHGAGGKDKTGTGSLLLDTKKQYAIKHWLERTSKDAKAQVTLSLRDAPFAFGPWGEALSIMSFLFLESTTDLMASADCGLVPGASEASIPLEWALPLTTDAQANLFFRIRVAFEKSTAIIDNPADKKRYRMSEEELMALRNTMALWSQIRAFCSTRLAKFDEFNKAVTTGNAKDFELREILDQRPASFSLSMLSSYQKQALEEVLAAEEGATLEAETERLKVRDARWAWFKGALERDQAIVRQIGSAPDKIQALRHRKQMAWRLVQAKNGEKLVRSYMEKHLRTEFVTKAELAQQKVNEFRSHVAKTSGRPESDIYMVGIVDLNVPGAKASERVQELSQCVQFLNDLAPERHASLLEMAEHAKRSSKRGISDEEREVEESLWSLRQVLDVRWVMPFNLHPSAEQQSNRRRFSLGRVVGNIDSQESNIWLTSSELALCGRPLSEQSVQLPLSKDLILPESLSPEDDLKQAERQRPSTETAAAQKGISRWMCLLESLLTVSGSSFKDKSVIVCNFTPYVEDVGCAVFNMRLQEKDFKGGFNTKNLYYLSVSWISKDQFGAARLCREVTDAWCQKKFKHAGQEFTTEAPELSNQEIEAVPGGKASLGQLDQIKFEVLERTAGDKLTIRTDEHKFWTAQGGEISETYGKLREKHQELIGQQNSVATPVEPSTSTDETSGEGTAEVTLESLGKLEEKHGVETKTPSESPNVEIVLCKDGSVWLLSSQDKALAKHALLGGFGTGQWVADSDDSPGIPFSISQGDKTMVQLDESSFAPEAQGIATMTMFKLLVRAERDKGLTQHRVSFLSIERKQDGVVEAGQDGFDIKVKTPQKFKCMKDPRATEGGQEKISMKNFFGKALEATRGSQHIMHLFRYRYEKIGQNFKIQRPYVVTKRGITLKKGCPLKVSGNTSG